MQETVYSPLSCLPSISMYSRQNLNYQCSYFFQGFLWPLTPNLPIMQQVNSARKSTPSIPTTTPTNPQLQLYTDRSWYINTPAHSSLVWKNLSCVGFQCFSREISFHYRVILLIYVLHVQPYFPCLLPYSPIAVSFYPQINYLPLILTSELTSGGMQANLSSIILQ